MPSILTIATSSGLEANSVTLETPIAPPPSLPIPPTMVANPFDNFKTNGNAETQKELMVLAPTLEDIVAGGIATTSYSPEELARLQEHPVVHIKSLDDTHSDSSRRCNIAATDPIPEFEDSKVALGYEDNKAIELLESNNECVVSTSNKGNGLPGLELANTATNDPELPHSKCKNVATALGASTESSDGFRLTSPNEIDQSSENGHPEKKCQSDRMVSTSQVHLSGQLESSKSGLVSVPISGVTPGQNDVDQQPPDEIAEMQEPLAVVAPARKETVTPEHSPTTKLSAEAAQLGKSQDGKIDFSKITYTDAAAADSKPEVEQAMVVLGCEENPLVNVMSVSVFSASKDVTKDPQAKSLDTTAHSVEQPHHESTSKTVTGSAESTDGVKWLYSTSPIKLDSSSEDEDVEKNTESVRIVSTSEMCSSGQSESSKSVLASVPSSGASSGQNALDKQPFKPANNGEKEVGAVLTAKSDTQKGVDKKMQIIDSVGSIKGEERGIDSLLLVSTSAGDLPQGDSTSSVPTIIEIDLAMPETEFAQGENSSKTRTRLSGPASAAQGLSSTGTKFKAPHGKSVPRNARNSGILLPPPYSSISCRRSCPETRNARLAPVIGEQTFQGNSDGRTSSVAESSMSLSMVHQNKITSGELHSTALPMSKETPTKSTETALKFLLSRRSAVKSPSLKRSASSNKTLAVGTAILQDKPMIASTPLGADSASVLWDLEHSNLSRKKRRYTNTNADSPHGSCHLPVNNQEVIVLLSSSDDDQSASEASNLNGIQTNVAEKLEPSVSSEKEESFWSFMFQDESIEDSCLTMQDADEDDTVSECDIPNDCTHSKHVQGLAPSENHASIRPPGVNAAKPCGCCLNCIRASCGMCNNCILGKRQSCFQKMCLQVDESDSAVHAPSFPSGWRFYFGQDKKYCGLFILGPGGLRYKRAESAVNRSPSALRNVDIQHFYQYVGLDDTRATNERTNQKSSSSMGVGVRCYAMYTNRQWYWGTVKRIYNRRGVKFCNVLFDDGDTRDRVPFGNGLELITESEYRNLYPTQIIPKRPSRLEQSDTEQDCTVLNARDLRRRRCHNCSACRTESCGFCFSCVSNKENTTLYKQQCFLTVCSQIKVSEKAHAVPRLDSYTFYFDNEKSDRCPRWLPPKLAGLVVIDANGSTQRFTKSSKPCTLFDSRSKEVQDFYEGFLGIPLREQNVEHTLVGKGFRRDWLDVNGNCKTLSGIISSCEKDIFSGDYYFTITYDNWSLSFLDCKYSLVEEKDLAEEAVWGGYCLFLDRAGKVPQPNKGIRCERWICPDACKVSAASVTSKNFPHMCLSVRGFLLEFQVKKSTIKGAGLGVFVRCASMNDSLKAEGLVLAAREYIDLGIYAPLVPEQKIPEHVNLALNFVHEWKCEEWNFSLWGHPTGWIYNISDVVTGELSTSSRQNLLSYVNETDGKEAPLIRAAHDPEGAVHYLLGFEQGDNLHLPLDSNWMELKINYGSGYEKVRVRKGYSRLSHSEQEKFRELIASDDKDTLDDVMKWSAQDLIQCLTKFEESFVIQKGDTPLREIAAARAILIVIQFKERIKSFQEEFATLDDDTSFCDNGYTDLEKLDVVGRCTRLLGALLNSGSTRTQVCKFILKTRELCSTLATLLKCTEKMLATMSVSRLRKTIVGDAV